MGICISSPSLPGQQSHPQLTGRGGGREGRATGGAYLKEELAALAVVILLRAKGAELLVATGGVPAKQTRSLISLRGGRRTTTTLKPLPPS